MTQPPIALTVAGSDSGGGAGIQADLRTFAWHGVHGVSVITAVTAQNTVGLRGAWGLEPAAIAAQFAAIADDMDVAAVKTGMLADVPTITAVAAGLCQVGAAHLVIDPVMIATSGDRLLAADAVAALTRLWPAATLITPNIPEAQALLGKAFPCDHAGRAQAALALAATTGAAVLLKGGHARDDADDCLVVDEQVTWLRGERVAGAQLHGTGCHLSAAITARLARGEALTDAVAGGIGWLRRAIANAQAVGAGARVVWPPQS